MASDTSHDELYHLLLSTSHIKNDTNSLIEKLRVCGTYNILSYAKRAAHRLLWDAGYERSFFTTYETKDAQFDALIHKKDIELKHSRVGLAVLAEATDGTRFKVWVATTKNVSTANGHQVYGGEEDGRVREELYHVLQTIVLYDEDETGEVRETQVLASFITEQAARQMAKKALLSEEDGVTTGSFASWEEAGPDDRDCGYGENVIVHAIGTNGENFLLSVLKSQELEAVRLAEASMRIR